MALVVGMFILGVICAIAAALVFREALRMQDRAPLAVFDPDDAYEFVAQHLDELVASTLTPDDLRRILGFQIEFLQRAGVAKNGSTATPPGDVVVGEFEMVDHVLRRCAETGEAYLPEQVQPVIECQLTYLRAIGSVGRPAGRDDDRPGPAGTGR